MTRVVASGMTRQISRERAATAASESRKSWNQVCAVRNVGLLQPGRKRAGRQRSSRRCFDRGCSVAARAATMRSALISHATRGRVMWFVVMMLYFSW